MAPVDNRRTAVRENRWISLPWDTDAGSSQPVRDPVGIMDADVSACKHFRSGERPKCRASGTTRRTSVSMVRGDLLLQPQVVDVAATQGRHRLPIDAEHGTDSTGG